MFKKTLFYLLAGMFTVLLPLGTSAAFVKTGACPEGKFTDVPKDSWYAPSVAEAFEYGIMTGDSETSFNPDGTLTVAEGITLSCRIHAALDGQTLQVQPAEPWYKPYVDYAVAHGFCKQGQFDDYDRPIKRYEIAELLADVCGELPVINEVDGIYDVPSEKVLSLYRAGILGGNDEYGTFAPTTSLKRCEIAAMAVRVADETRRVKRTFLPLSARRYGDAYSIVENVSSYGPNGLANGWNSDTRFDLANANGLQKMTLGDSSDAAFYALTREFSPEDSGVLHLELILTASSDDKGITVAFETADGKELLTMTPSGGVWQLAGTDSLVTSVSVDETTAAKYYIVMDIDLDACAASLVMNNTVCGDVRFERGAPARLAVRTTKGGKATVSVNHTKLYKDYAFIEHFFVGESAAGQTPAGWYTSGSFRAEKNLGMPAPDLYSMKSETKAGERSEAFRAFTPVAGTFSFETAILLPEKTDGASVALLSAGKPVLTFETKNGGLYMGDILLNDYLDNVWQALLVDGDTSSGKATVKVNGKKRAVVDFDAQSIDAVKVSFAPAKDAVMWFDDVKMYNLVEHEDYPAYPQVAESKNYNVGINVCDLWRDQQSGEGWDSVSAFSEFDTYLGFYDEGLRETADWEIKLMAEHGIDFMHICWYAPYSQLSEPIKQMRVSYSALHDGYMNAKYSDLLDFCIMWENNGQDVTSFEQFKEYIWKYWVEYYFKDDRYVRVDNKALLTVWNRWNFVNAFGGSEGAKAAVEFMNEDIKKYGYDGIVIITGAGPGANSTALYKELGAIGFDGSYTYAWTDPSAESQIKFNKSDIESAKQVGSFHLPTVGMGFNDVGRNEHRDGISTKAAHLEVCRFAKDYLDTLKTGTFVDNTVMLSTWNEYSEGHYLMPTTSTGFDYLENIRAVFTDDTSDHTKADAPLTQTQKDRIGHMYPKNRALIRWLQNEESEADSDEAEDAPKVVVNGMQLDFTFLPKKTADGDLLAVGEARNKGFYSNLRLYYTWDRFTGDGVLTLETIDEKTVVLTVGSDKAVVNGESRDAGFTFTLRDGLPVFHMKKLCELLGYKYHWDGETFEIQACSDSEYEILKKRVPNCWEFDLPGAADGWHGQDVINIIADEKGFLTGDATSVDPAIMHAVSFNASEYSHIRVGVVYHKGLYEGFTPQIFYTRPDSKAYTADKVFNGAYVIPEDVKDGDIIEAVFEIPRLMDVEFTNIRFDMFAKPGKVEIDYIRFLMERDPSENVVTYIEPDDENRWYFDTDGDLEGWYYPEECVGEVSDGVYRAKPTYPDPMMMRDVNFPAGSYQVAIIGVKNNGKLQGDSGSLYFSTAENPGLSEEKVVRAEYKVPKGTNPGDTVELILDLTRCANYKGNVTMLRFDPLGGMVDFEIDYIKLCQIEGYEPPEEIPVEPAEPTRPTQVEIADAARLPEGVSVSGFNADVTVIADPENADKNVFKVSGKPEDGFTYMNVFMNFEAGKTYRVTYRIYPLTDYFEGSYTDATIGGNFRYASGGGAISDHTIKDHQNKSTGAGWVNVEDTLTIAGDYVPREGDCFQFWAPSQNGSGINFLVSDIRIVLDE